ncbi:Phage P22-like portal protein [uncultured Caudovirales phage]|uniref:Phage P22-like portal protein n=1 Tax=uncultured Caudovirales phage TaxID=2100421 RepID=A0A6J7XBG9_9CAUD|nr:Phage P22-like portal protein [uncultured Caudovirales phage]CAB5224980.1 Phage P22-like portal protein [uncultured Caudovirales phage]
MDNYTYIDDEKGEEGLKELKALVTFTQEYNKVNIENYKACMKFVFNKTFWGSDESRLLSLGLPCLAANSIEPFVNRLLGEFADSHPDLHVSYDADEEDDKKKIYEAYVDHTIRNVLDNFKANDLDNQVFRSMMAGGAAVIKVGYDYENPETFKQDFKLEYCDPTMCGFDPKAIEKDKSDGDYCYRLYPMTSTEIQEKYHIDHNEILALPFPTQGDGFDFSYTMPNKDRTRIIYVCELFQKKYRNFNLLLLSDNTCMREEDYTQKYGKIVMQKKTKEGELEDDSTQDALQEAMGVVKQNSIKPKVVEKSERREVDYIERVVFIGNKIVEEKEPTVYKSLPLVFFDGNGWREGLKHIWRSYFHNVIDVQRLKNFVMNQLADEVSSLRKSDVLMPEAALPKNKDYLRPYLDPNFRGGILVYNHQNPRPLPSGLPDVIPAPQYFPRGQVNEVYLQFLDRTEQMQQNQLGAYDAQLGDARPDMSKVGIVASTTQSNAAAKPVMINYISSMNQVAKIIIEVTPYIKVTPETVPLRIDDKEHFLDFGGDGIKLDYNIYNMKVHMKEGSNFAQTKRDNVELLGTLGERFPALAQIINTKGLSIVLDNLDFKGSDKLRDIAKQMQDNPPPPPPPSPDMIKANATMMHEQTEQMKLKMIEEPKLQLEQQRFQFEQEKFKEDLTERQLRLHLDDQKVAVTAKADNVAAELELRRQNMEHQHSSVDKVLDWEKFRHEKVVDLAKSVIQSTNKTSRE